MLRRESYAGRSQSVPVYLRVYDISNGRVAVWSQLVLRRRIEGIWHTGIHVFGFEYFYGGGINCMTSSQVETSFDMDIVETRLLGQTQRTRAEFERYLLHLYEKFTPETYDLIKWNCNHFSDTCARFLLENNGIPTSILNLPYIVGSTFLGNVALKVFQRVSQGHNPAGFSPDDPNHPRHEFFPDTNENMVDVKEGSLSVKSVPIMIPCCGINYFSEDEDDFNDDDSSVKSEEPQRKQSTGSITTMTSPNDASNVHEGVTTNATLSEYSNICPALHEQTWIDEPSQTDTKSLDNVAATAAAASTTEDNCAAATNDGNRSDSALSGWRYPASAKDLNLLKQPQQQSIRNSSNKHSSNTRAASSLPSPSKKYSNPNENNSTNFKQQQSSAAAASVDAEAVKRKSNKICSLNPPPTADLPCKKSLPLSSIKWDEQKSRSQQVDNAVASTEAMQNSEFMSVYLSERQKNQTPVILGARNLLADKYLPNNSARGTQSKGFLEQCSDSRKATVNNINKNELSQVKRDVEKGKYQESGNKKVPSSKKSDMETKNNSIKQLPVATSSTVASSKKTVNSTKTQNNFHNFPDIFGSLDDFLKAPSKVASMKRDHVTCPECGAMSKSTDLMCRECGLDFMLIMPVSVTN